MSGRSMTSPFTVAELEQMAAADERERQGAAWEEEAAARLAIVEGLRNWRDGGNQYRRLERVNHRLRVTNERLRKKFKERQVKERKAAAYIRLDLSALTPRERWQLGGLCERHLRGRFIIAAIKEGLRRIRDAAER